MIPQLRSQSKRKRSDDEEIVCQEPNEKKQKASDDLASSSMDETEAQVSATEFICYRCTDMHQGEPLWVCEEENKDKRRICLPCAEELRSDGDILCSGCNRLRWKRAFRKPLRSNALNIIVCTDCELTTKEVCNRCKSKLNLQQFTSLMCKGKIKRAHTCGNCTRLKCSQCDKTRRGESFSKADRKDDAANSRVCRLCKPLCSQCDKSLPRNCFTKVACKASHIGDAITPLICLSCFAENALVLCNQCEKRMSRSCFSKKALEKDETTRICRTCTHEKRRLLCNQCKQNLPKDSFNKGVRKADFLHSRICRSCITENQTLLCNRCEMNLPRESFSKAERKEDVSNTRLCRGCKEEKVQLRCHQCDKTQSWECFDTADRKGDAEKFRLCRSCNEGSMYTLCYAPYCNAKTGLECGCKSAQQGKLKKTPQFCPPRTEDPKMPSENGNGNKETQARQGSIAETLQWLSERRSLAGTEARSFVLQWSSSSISLKDEIDMKYKLLIKGHFGSLTQDETHDLAHFIQTSSSAMTLNQAISLRSNLLQQKAVQCHHTLVQNTTQLVSMYKAGDSIVSLSKHFDAPPLNVLRVVLQGLKYSKDQIRKGFRDPENSLEPRERAELKEAQKGDSVASVDQEKIHAAAEAFEDCIAEFLQKQGIQFVRQNQLAKEQRELFGRVVLTPDFLILDDLEINGKKVRWIDAKAYYGAILAKFFVEKTCKQMRGYIQQWGAGAIVFSQGFNEKFSTRLENCSTLDATDFIDEKKLYGNRNLE